MACRFDIMPGEVLGLVGESGSGKSVTALSILRLIPDPPGKSSAVPFIYKGQDLLKLSWEEIRKVRGNEISMIFQEPMTSLNPVFTIGMQIMEVILEHNNVSGQGSVRSGREDARTGRDSGSRQPHERLSRISSPAACGKES